MPSFLVVQDISDRVVEACKVEKGGAVSEKYAYFDELTQNNISSSFKRIEIAKISYNKPVLVIYNPSSGIQIDRRK